MLTIYFNNGSKQVIYPSAEFYQEPKGKSNRNKYGRKMAQDLTVNEKCQDICHDLKGERFELELPND